MQTAEFLHLSPESRLLIQCARTRFLAFHADQVANLLAQGIHWPSFLRLTQVHGATPLVSRNLRAVHSKSIPPEYLESLQNYSKTNAVLTQFLTTELVEVIEAFQAEKILVVPFKGPTLALSAYGALHLREFGDLDLCVRQKDVPVARRILESREYQPKDETSRKESDEDLRKRVFHTFVNRNGMVHIDLQWNMTGQPYYSFVLDQPIFWEDLQTVCVAGKSIPTFNPENLLIILCVHGSKHVWECLKWICDVAELLISHSRLNWDVVVSRSSNLRVRRMVFMGAYLAHWYFQAPLPPDLQRTLLSDPDIPSLAMCIPDDLLGKPQHGVTERYSGGFYFLLKDSGSERWKYGLKLCQTTNAIFTTPLPWFRSQRTLQVMFWMTFPFRMAIRNLIRFFGLREPASKLVASWLK